MPQSEKLTFVNGAGQELAGRLELPDAEPKAFAIFAHCFTCSKESAAAGRISRALSARGIAVLRFDFTGIGNSDGDFANTNFSSNLEDLLAAADFLRSQHQPPSLLVGHSLGGAAVLGVASRIPEVKAVVTIGAPSEPQHVIRLLADSIEKIEQDGCAFVQLGGRRFEIKKQFLDDLEDQTFTARIRAMKAALLVCHSPVDEVVGIDEARKIYEAARHPKSFLSLDDADHLLTRAEDSGYVAAALVAWVSRYLSIPAEAAPLEVAAVPSRSTAGHPEGRVVVTEVAGGLKQTIHLGAHRMVADEPVSVGGTDEGPTPYDLLLAALGACTSMTLRIYAQHKGLPLESVQVALSHSRIHAKDCADCESESGMVDQIVREITISGDLTPEQRERMLQIADRCPVHKTLMNEKKIRTRLV